MRYYVVVTQKLYGIRFRVLSLSNILYDGRLVKSKGKKKREKIQLGYLFSFSEAERFISLLHACG